jgi:hypothetical protein
MKRIHLWFVAALGLVKWSPHILLWYVGIPITVSDAFGMQRDADRIRELWTDLNSEKVKQ